MLRATLASARLEFRRADGRIVVWRRAEPDALLLPVSFSERHYGHVPYRAGGGSAARPAGLQGVLAADLRFKGSVRQGSTWTAMVSTPTGLYDLRVGYRVFDGTVESVSGDVVRILREDGKRIEVRLSPAPPGISIVPEAAEQVVDRAAVLTDAGEFDAAEGVLRAALEAAEGADRDALSAALSDLHYAWGQARLVAAPRARCDPPLRERLRDRRPRAALAGRGGPERDRLRLDRHRGARTRGRSPPTGSRDRPHGGSQPGAEAIHLRPDPSPLGVDRAVRPRWPRQRRTGPRPPRRRQRPLPEGDPPLAQGGGPLRRVGGPDRTGSRRAGAWPLRARHRAPAGSLGEAPGRAPLGPRGRPQQSRERAARPRSGR